MIDEPDARRSFPALLRAAAAEHGEAVALVAEREGRAAEPLSFAALEAQSAVLARGLLARGVGKGARIGFIAGNGPQFAVWLAAIARIGAVAIPISTMARGAELVRILRHADVGGLIVQRAVLGHDLVARLAEALPELSGPDVRLAEVPYLRWIVTEGDDLPPAFRPMAFLTQPAATIAPALLAAIEAEVYPTDQMVEIYTSGSMALPKGVRHDHGAVCARARWLARMLGIRAGGTIVAQLPMFWVGGMMMALLPGLAAGATVVCPPRTLNNSRVAMGTVLADEELALLSAQPKPWWALGMSETLGPYSFADDFRAEGYPLCAPLDHIAEGFTLRLAGEDGAPVPDGVPGEIQLRGGAVTPGLHKIARATCFTADGFYRTGDMGLREGTRIHFVGRAGDMIKTAGSNVSPAEVEAELQALPRVHSAYVLGLPDTERGQRVVAAVVPREGVALDVAALEAALKAQLSPYKVPRAFVVLARDEVPMLASNKVFRRELARLCAERLTAPPA